MWRFILLTTTQNNATCMKSEKPLLISMKIQRWAKMLERRLNIGDNMENILSDKTGIIRTVTKQSVLAAEAVYYQFCNFPSVLAGVNQVKMNVTLGVL